MSFRVGLKFLGSVILMLVGSSTAFAEARLSLGPTFGLMESRTGWGGSATLLFRVTRSTPLYFGFETGYVYYSAGSVRFQILHLPRV